MLLTFVQEFRPVPVKLFSDSLMNFENVLNKTGLERFLANHRLRYTSADVPGGGVTLPVWGATRDKTPDRRVRVLGGCRSAQGTARIHDPTQSYFQAPLVSTTPHSHISRHRFVRRQSTVRQLCRVSSHQLSAVSMPNCPKCEKPVYFGGYTTRTAKVRSNALSMIRPRRCGTDSCSHLHLKTWIAFQRKNAVRCGSV
uniref:Uncharacterized protein n=1 Tax=Timema bartmani TaxID=61472 RepID=A0A7R9I4Z5_9NEOP|nr:unnamed protein product [Timema bartmani]